MPIKYVPFIPEPIEGQAVLCNFNRILKYKGADDVSMTLQREMPLYEMEKVETVDENADGNMVIRGECVSACAYLKEKGIQVDLVYIDPPFAIAECIEQFIRRNLEDGQEIYPILPIVMQCFDDESYVARRRACDCMMLLLNTKYKEVAERKLFEASLDPSHFVRSHVLDLCRDGKTVILGHIYTSPNNDVPVVSPAISINSFISRVCHFSLCEKIWRYREAR